MGRWKRKNNRQKYRLENSDRPIARETEKKERNFKYKHRQTDEMEM